MFDEARQSAIYNDDDESLKQYLGLGQCRRVYWQDYEDEGCSDSLEANEDQRKAAACNLSTQDAKLTFDQIDAMIVRKEDDDNDDCHSNGSGDDGDDVEVDIDDGESMTVGASLGEPQLPADTGGYQQ